MTTKDWSEHDALEALATLPGMRRRSLEALRGRYRSWAAAATAPAEELASYVAASGVGAGSVFDGDLDLRAHLARVRERAAACGAVLLTEADRAWPARLRTLEVAEPDSQSPTVLWVRGELEAEQPTFSVAVVGPRRADTLAREQTAQIASGLAQAGVTVVSGGAAGVDTIAHRAALDAGGHTLCVLGTGVDVAYPVRNRELFERIVDSGGALVSELPPGQRARPFTFPMRNRIISGLADVVVVIAATSRSGTLITARHGAEQERVVCAVPGDPRRSLSSGTNRLLVQGAAAVLEPADVIELLVEHRGATLDGGRALRWVEQQRRLGGGGAMATGSQLPLSSAARTLLAALEPVPQAADVLAAASGLTSSLVASGLAELELAGLAERVAGGYLLAFNSESADLDAG